MELDKRHKPKLLFFVTEDWYFASHRLPLAAAAVEDGYEVVLVTRVDRHLKEITRHGIRVIPTTISRSGLNPLKELGSLAELQRIYKRERPDIVHHVALKPVIYGSLVARSLGIKGVVNALGGFGFIYSSNRLKARLLRPGINHALKLAIGGQHTQTILQNSDDKDQIIGKGFAKPQHIHLVRGAGVNVTKYAKSPPPHSVEPLVILPSRLLRDKGVEEFAEAARLLKARGIKARFALIGKPDKENPNSISETEIESWVKGGILEYWGWRADMPEVLAQSALVCLPTYGEGLPKSLLEAAASARAIVTTDIPGCREIVRPGVNGWLVPPRDIPALTSALEEAIGNPDLCAKYGKEGRQMVKNDFSLDYVIAETLHIYHKLLEHKLMLPTARIEGTSDE